MNAHQHEPRGFIAWMLALFAGAQELLHSAGLTFAHCLGVFVIAVITGLGAALGSRLAGARKRP